MHGTSFVADSTPSKIALANTAAFSLASYMRARALHASVSQAAIPALSQPQQRRASTAGLAHSTHLDAAPTATTAGATANAPVVGGRLVRQRSASWTAIDSSDVVANGTLRPAHLAAKVLGTSAVGDSLIEPPDTAHAPSNASGGGVFPLITLHVHVSDNLSSHEYGAATKPFMCVPQCELNCAAVQVRISLAWIAAVAAFFDVSVPLAHSTAVSTPQSASLVRVQCVANAWQRMTAPAGADNGDEFVAMVPSAAGFDATTPLILSRSKTSSSFSLVETETQNPLHDTPSGGNVRGQLYAQVGHVLERLPRADVAPCWSVPLSCSMPYQTRSAPHAATGAVRVIGGRTDAWYDMMRASIGDAFALKHEVVVLELHAGPSAIPASAVPDLPSGSSAGSSNDDEHALMSLKWWCPGAIDNDDDDDELRSVRSAMALAESHVRNLTAVSIDIRDLDSDSSLPPQAVSRPGYIVSERTPQLRPPTVGRSIDEACDIVVLGAMTGVVNVQHVPKIDNSAFRAETSLIALRYVRLGTVLASVSFRGERAMDGFDSLEVKLHTKTYHSLLTPVLSLLTRLRNDIIMDVLRQPARNLRNLGALIAEKLGAKALVHRHSTTSAAASVSSVSSPTSIILPLAAAPAATVKASPRAGVLAPAAAALATGWQNRRQKSSSMLASSHTRMSSSSDDSRQEGPGQQEQGSASVAQTTPARSSQRSAAAQAFMSFFGRSDGFSLMTGLAAPPTVVDPIAAAARRRGAAGVSSPISRLPASSPPPQLSLPPQSAGAAGGHGSPTRAAPAENEHTPPRHGGSG